MIGRIAVAVMALTLWPASASAQHWSTNTPCDGGATTLDCLDPMPHDYCDGAVVPGSPPATSDPRDTTDRLSTLRISAAPGGSCSASAWSEHFVITAAHCLCGLTTDDFIDGGSLHVEVVPDGPLEDRVYMFAARMMPGYDECASILGDIAMLWTPYTVPPPYVSTIYDPITDHANCENTIMFSGVHGHDCDVVFTNAEDGDDNNLGFDGVTPTTDMTNYGIMWGGCVDPWDGIPVGGWSGGPTYALVDPDGAGPDPVEVHMATVTSGPLKLGSVKGYEDLNGFFTQSWPTSLHTFSNGIELIAYWLTDHRKANPPTGQRTLTPSRGSSVACAVRLNATANPVAAGGCELSSRSTGLTTSCTASVMNAAGEYECFAPIPADVPADWELTGVFAVDSAGTYGFTATAPLLAANSFDAIMSGGNALVSNRGGHFRLFIADAVFANASGSAVDITSAGSNLPAMVADDKFFIAQSASNDGYFEVTTVNTSTSDYTFAMLFGDTPVNDAAEERIFLNEYSINETAPLLNDVVVSSWAAPGEQVYCFVDIGGTLTKRTGCSFTAPDFNGSFSASETRQPGLWQECLVDVPDSIATGQTIDVEYAFTIDQSTDYLRGLAAGDSFQTFDCTDNTADLTTSSTWGTTTALPNRVGGVGIMEMYARVTTAGIHGVMGFDDTNTINSEAQLTAGIRFNGTTGNIEAFENGSWVSDVPFPYEINTWYRIRFFSDTWTTIVNPTIIYSVSVAKCGERFKEIAGSVVSNRNFDGQRFYNVWTDTGGTMQVRHLSSETLSCFPTQCVFEGWECDFALDGCGGLINCGTCGGGDTCTGQFTYQCVP